MGDGLRLRLQAPRGALYCLVIEARYETQGAKHRLQRAACAMNSDRHRVYAAEVLLSTRFFLLV
jgi:hypothetical protein